MTTLKGLDANFELTKHAASLESQGFDFAIRDYSHNAAKNLSLGEAKTLSAAGLEVGAVWETGGNQASFFNPTQGVADRAAAYHLLGLLSPRTSKTQRILSEITSVT